MVIRVLHEARVHFHLAAQHRLEILRHLVPTRDLLVPRRELAVLRDHPQLLLAGEGLFTQRVPALVELALVLVSPFLRHMVRRVRRARRKVDEERLVRGETLLLSDPGDRLVGHVVDQVVAFFGRLLRLDRRGPLVERRVPLVGLAADEAVEILEAATAGWPGVERSCGTRFPDRHFMALAELGGRVAIQLQGLRQRRHRVGQHRVVARCARRNLGDAAHAHGVVIAACQQGLPRRRAERGGVEAGELQPACGQLLRGRRLTGPAEGAGRAEAHVVDRGQSARWERPWAGAIARSEETLTPDPSHRK